MRTTLGLLILALLPSCQISLLSPDPSPAIDGPRPGSHRTTAIPAPDFVRLHGDPEIVEGRIRVRVVFADGRDSALTFESGIRLRKSLSFVLPGESLKSLMRVGVYRELESPMFILCDLGVCERYGDLQQDLMLAEGDLLFVPGVSDSILEEFFSVSGILASP